MKFTIFLMLWTSAVFAAPEPTEVRVRLKHEAHILEVHGYGLNITAPSAFIPVKFVPGLLSAKISLGKTTWNVRWSDGRALEKIASERIWVRGQKLQLGTRVVPADLELFRAGKSGIDVIARIDLDDYLEGVLPSEMPLSWPAEALKAQVIAARSYVLKQRLEHRDRDYDVEDGIEDQVYRFNSGGDLQAKLQRVMKQTRGQILLTPQNGILKAFYSADCGCHSEDPKFVWGGGVEHGLGSLQSVTDPTCGSRKITEWSLTLDSQDAREKLIKALELPQDASLKTLLLAGRTPSGRVSQVIATMVVDGKDLNFVMNTQEFRHLIGYTRVRSSDFKLRWSGKEILISGRGSGHGVGLCQNGARTMAEQGQKSDEILKTFYPKAHLSVPAVHGRIL